MSRCGVIKIDRYEELAGQRYEFRQWRRWRRERVQELLDGPYAEPAHALLAFLKTTPAPTALLEFVIRGPWATADPETRAEILALLDRHIVTQRERMNLPPFDDALNDTPLNLFLRIRDLLFPLNGGATRGEARS
jgi:hypothetical protein